MSETEFVDPRKLRPRPICHRELPAELLNQIKAVFDVIGRYFNMNLEQFEIGFMRDKNPEREMALWCGIAKAWLAYHEDFLANNTLADEEERKLLRALVVISSGVTDLSMLNVPEVVGRRLIQCFGDPAADQRPKG